MNTSSFYLSVSKSFVSWGPEQKKMCQESGGTMTAVLFWGAGWLRPQAETKAEVKWKCWVSCSGFRPGSLLRRKNREHRGCGLVCNMAATSATLGIYHLVRAINVPDWTECQSAQQLEEGPGKQDCWRGWHDKAKQKLPTFYLIQPLHLLHVWEIDLSNRKVKRKRIKAM